MKLFYHSLKGLAMCMVTLTDVITLHVHKQIKPPEFAFSVAIKNLGAYFLPYLFL